jgi:hypothetical protein
MPPLSRTYHVDLARLRPTAGFTPPDDRECADDDGHHTARWRALGNRWPEIQPSERKGRTPEQLRPDRGDHLGRVSCQRRGRLLRPRAGGSGAGTFSDPFSCCPPSVRRWSSNTETVRQTRDPELEYRDCPFCVQMIPSEATICPNCHRDLRPPIPDPRAHRRVEPGRRRSSPTGHGERSKVFESPALITTVGGSGCLRRAAV